MLTPSADSSSHVTTVAANVASDVDADIRESRLRIRVASVMLIGLLDLLFGAAWDGQWHAMVGRDRFLTLPHIAIYSGASILGLLCLGMVLFETVRYHRHVPGVNDQTTSHVLWIFHAPLGFIVTGFGMLMIVLSAPLDNYWHVLYGIDVTLWSPFHMMGLLSGLIAFLGVVYLFGAEATRARQRQSHSKGALRSWGRNDLTELLLLVGLALLLPFALITALDDIQFFSLGTLQFAIYPLVASFCAFVLVASVRATNRIGAATLTALLFTLLRLGLNLTIIPAVNAVAQQEHLFYRIGAPNFVIFVHIYPAFLIVGGLLVDITYWLAGRLSLRASWLMTATAMVAGALVGLSVATLETTAWQSDIPPTLFTSIWFASMPLAALVGACWGWLGDRFAISVRLLHR